MSYVFVLGIRGSEGAGVNVVAVCPDLSELYDAVQQAIRHNAGDMDGLTVAEVNSDVIREYRWESVTGLYSRYGEPGLFDREVE